MQALKGYDDGIQHSELLGSGVLTTVRYSNNYRTRRFVNWMLPSSSEGRETHSLLDSLENPRSKFEVDFATDGQSGSQSWCRAVLWGPWPDSKVPYFYPTGTRHLVFLRSVRRLLVTASVVPSSLILVTLMR
jgi:hypothetical protein